MLKTRAVRYHDLSAGHRVYGQKDMYGNPGPCSRIHGHNYRITFYCSTGKLDDLGMVIDFGIIKALLCAWLDSEWDHKTLIWEDDPLADALDNLLPENIVMTSFNPTAENIAAYLLEKVGPTELKNFPEVTLTKVKVQETRKCFATASL